MDPGEKILHETLRQFLLMQASEKKTAKQLAEILGTGYSTPERTDRAYFTKSGIE
jgi:hypothetical protein